MDRGRRVALRSESVGLDARGRPVAVVVGEGTEHEHVCWVFRYPREDVVEQLSGAMVERIALEDGRAVRIVSATMAGHARVRLVTWRDGVAVRVDGARAWKGDDARAEARAATREQAWSAEEDAPAPGGLAAAIEPAPRAPADCPARRPRVPGRDATAERARPADGGRPRTRRRSGRGRRSAACRPARRRLTARLPRAGDRARSDIDVGADPGRRARRGRDRRAAGGAAAHGSAA